MPRGAARSEAARAAILASVASLVDRVGYDAVTIEGIAAAAGVGKQTIYRWYPSKSAIIAEALVEGRLLGEDFTIPDTGDPVADIAAWLEHVLRFLASRNHSALLSSLIAASVDSPEIGLRISQRLGLGGPTIAERVRQATDAGELASPLSPDQIDQLIVGIIMMRALGRNPYVEGEARQLVGALLDSSTRADSRP
ncbi:TetR/AcrR family transcriptional regulator [Gryllotalpicola reticulitermitis]|uniref:TetR/AcrR family transcriptional regulator n=1 Tax=Gryllotalpicola reticulitermitis TaxID=1184153 RepID=A0ABV8Q7Z4_9MICO